jgi:3-hydroxyisobutyrate dehydrogenase-like beta-hydroxyacid dehydrogenase
MNAPNTQPPPVTVVGLGLMGSALARALLDAGHPTTVWNRTAAKADALAAEGARRADRLAAAIAASPLTIVCLLDADSVHETLDRAAEALAGQALVNLTSGTPEQARATAAWATERGADYLDGKIMAVPRMIGRPEAFLLYSGSTAVFETHRPTLERLGAATYFGADSGLASLYDIALLGQMYATITGFLHSVAVLNAEGVDAATYLPYAMGIHETVGDLLTSAAGQLESGDYGAQDAALEMQAVAIDHIAETSRSRGVDATIPSHVADLAQRAIAAGHGGDDFTRVIDLLRTSRKVAT